MDGDALLLPVGDGDALLLLPVVDDDALLLLPVDDDARLPPPVDGDALTVVDNELSANGAMLVPRTNKDFDCILTAVFMTGIWHRPIFLDCATFTTCGTCSAGASANAGDLRSRTCGVTCICGDFYIQHG